MSPLRRRAVVRGLGSFAAAGALACCSAEETPPPLLRTLDRGGREASDLPPRRLSYGDHPSQFGEIHLPGGEPERARGVVVVLHGGFWLDAFGLSLGTPLAVDLAARGWAVWNLEYRRLGSGGGIPATLDDIAAGIDRLADVPGIDTSTLVALGHSAGGHLATWAGARAQATQSAWQPVRVPVTHIISQAGVLDLRLAGAQGLGNGAADRFLGGPASQAPATVDPIQQVPAGAPVWCMHSDGDATVPVSQSEAYTRAATRAGGQARLIRVSGDHFSLIDPRTPAWRRTLAVLDGISAPRR